jgi:predicted  nucleic acid-binding Zn-ribbon protein
MKNDLIFVGLVLVAICFSLESYQNNQELKRIHKLVEVERIAKIEAMKLAVELNDRLDIHLENNLSLNVEIDRLMNEIQELKGDKQLLKDIRRHWSER